MKSNVIAIDLGSSKTAIYRADAGLALFEPSVVALERDEKRTLKSVGNDAKKLIGRAAESTEVVMPIYESLISDEKATATMLETFINRITLHRLSARPSVIMNVPCGINIEELKKFDRVLQECGVSQVSFVESPILTAIGLGLPLSSSPIFLIDIGGGTTEISAISSDGVICGMSVNIGGRSIDQMISYFIEDNYMLKIGELTAETIKHSIGSLLEGDQMTMIVNGSDTITGRPKAISLSSSDMQMPIITFFDKIFQIVGMVMAKLPAEVAADIRRSGVYFSGGVSKIVGLEEYFNKKMGMRANLSTKGEIAALYGAGFLTTDNKLLKKYMIKTK